MSQWKIEKEILKCLETNDIENTTIQDLPDAAKAVVGGKFIVIQTFLKKKEKEKSQVNNLICHLNKL